MNFGKLLFAVLNGRVAGTGVNLGVDGGDGLVSYKKYRIWGFKSLVNAMVRHVHRTVLENLPERGPVTEECLVGALEPLVREFDVDEQLFREKTGDLLDDPTFWSSMDREQRLSFLVNAFFDALDETRVQLGAEAIAIVNSLGGRSLPVSFPKLVRDFGFLFRAREYARVFSDNTCAGGYANTVKRASVVLAREYEEQYDLPEDAPPSRGLPWREPPASGTAERPDGLILGVVSQLESPDPQERLSAIDELEQLADEQAVPYLERLLKDEDELVMNRAFEAILSLKGLSL
ncbi:MAG: HEAT repeat domain-containing protein [Promethearchaeota archaeon]